MNFGKIMAMIGNEGTPAGYSGSLSFLWDAPFDQAMLYNNAMPTSDLHTMR
jgi:hypothetical protein